MRDDEVRGDGMATGTDQVHNLYMKESNRDSDEVFIRISLQNREFSSDMGLARTRQETQISTDLSLIKRQEVRCVA